MKKLFICIILALFGNDVFAQNNDWVSYTYADLKTPVAKPWIRVIAKDLSGNIWVGTHGGGVSKFDGDTWTNYMEPGTGIKLKYVESLAVDSNGCVWFSMWNGFNQGHGLAMLFENEWKIYNSNNTGLAINSIWAINLDESGNKWLGLDRTGAGLARFDGETGELHDIPLCVSITKDFNGKRWFGTIFGLYIEDANSRIIPHPNSSKLPNSRVNSTAIDRYGAIWLGTSGGGMVKILNNQWTIYNQANSPMPSDSIQSIKIDKFGTKWICTAQGLAKFDEQKWEVFTMSNSPLLDNYIADITFNENDVWIATYNGVNVFKEGLLK
jgi:ligand-binding sensor domain-containing protein